MRSTLIGKLALLTAATGLIGSHLSSQTLKSERIISSVSNVTWVGSPPTDDRIFLYNVFDWVKD